MKPRLSIVIVVAMILFTATVAAILWETFPVWSLVWAMSSQMKTGQRYLDSLSNKDVPKWIERTESLLQQYDPRNPPPQYGPSEKPIPSDLAKLGILSIQIYKNTVYYVWLGGMDHTRLEVTKEKDNSYRFTRIYNDETSKSFDTNTTEQDAAANP